MRITGLAIALCLVAQAAMAQQMRFFTVGSGDVTGGYYAAANAICNVVNRMERGAMRCSPDPTNGSVYNLDALRRGELTFALVQSDLQAQALAGTGRFANVGPMPDLRSVMSLYPETMTILVRSDAGISQLSDLKGRRVDLGHPSSGRRATVNRMMSALGMEDSDFADALELPVGNAIDALCSGSIDATFIIVGHPNAAVARAVNECKAQLLPLSPEQIATVIGDGTDLISSAIPAGTYSPESVAIPTFAVTATLVTLADTPQDLVEAVVDDTLKSLKVLGSRAKILSDLDPMAMQKLGLTAPLHQGAQVAFARDVPAP